MSLNEQQSYILTGFTSTYCTFKIMDCSGIKYLFLTNYRNVPEDDGHTTVGIFVNLTEFDDLPKAVNWLVGTHMNTLYSMLTDSAAEGKDQYRYIAESKDMHEPYKLALIAQGIEQTKGLF